jgi:aminopeptidase N
MSPEGGNLTRDEARQRAEIVSDLGYTIDLDLTGDDRTFTSDVKLRFNAVEGAETFLDLSAVSVDDLVVNGRAIDPEPYFDRTRLRLPALRATNEVRVVATCAYEHSGVGLHRFTDPEDGGTYLHTQFEPFDAHRVFACFDQPDLKATFQLGASAPEEWTVVSNTAPTSQRPGRWEFAETPLLSTYLVALVAGPLHVVEDEHDGTPLHIYCRSSMREHLDAEEILTITKQGLDFFVEAFDHPYPFGKYDQLFVPEFVFGAMENPGCVTFTERYLFRGQVTEAERESRANTILHEMAHMWFGDLVTMRWWDDLWLNESFATFMAYLAAERATRFTDAWVGFEHGMKSWARYQDQLPTTHPVVADAPDVETAHQNFDGITYAKGASALRQLAAWVGEDAFLDGVRDYVRRFAWANATFDDLLEHLERASGRDDLRSWAEEWLTTTGVNALGPEVTAGADGTPEITVVQRAAEEHPTLRRHRVAVGRYAASGDGRLVRRKLTEVDVVGRRTPVGGGGGPTDLVLVNDRDLTFCRLILDERSIGTVRQRLSQIDDPLARSLVWGALWEMVRDAELPARTYVTIVRTHVPAEDDVGVLRTILGRALAAADHYGDPANAPATLRALARSAREQVGAEEPGSDRQLTWARHWARSARADDQTEELRALLDGQSAIEGLELDTELRWVLVTGLARAGAIGEDQIAAERQRDPTDFGERNAATARSARPDAEAKAAAWQRITGDGQLSHSLLKALMAGFQQRGQRELLEPYVEPYFAELVPMFQRLPLEVANAYAHQMYPAAVVDEDVVERTDQALSGEVPAPARRALLEERDSVLRALRTQPLDAEAPDDGAIEGGT